MLYLDELRPALLRINPSLPSVAIDEAINKLRKFENGSLLQKTSFMNYLQMVFEVSYCKDEQQNRIVKLVDYENIDKNSFYRYNQWL